MQTTRIPASARQHKSYPERTVGGFFDVALVLVSVVRALKDLCVFNIATG